MLIALALSCFEKKIKIEKRNNMVLPNFKKSEKYAKSSWLQTGERATWSPMTLSIDVEQRELAHNRQKKYALERTVIVQ